MSGFHERLDWIKGERAPYKFGDQVGWGRGVVQGVYPSSADKRRTVPGPEYLALLCLVENVSLNWLAAGVGAPYQIRSGLADSVWAEALALHATDAASGATELRLLLAQHAAEVVSVVYWLEGHPRPGEGFTNLLPVFRVDICTGQYGAQTAAQLAELARLIPSERVLLDQDGFQRLASGYMGNYELLGVASSSGQPGGLARDGVIISPQEIPQGSASTDMTMEEEMLLAYFRGMSPDSKAAFKQVGAALTQSSDKNLKQSG